MTSRILTVSRLALAAAAGTVCLFVNDTPSSIQDSSLITQAEARIARPRTPMSVAGVNRRVERRAYWRGYYRGVGSNAYYRPVLAIPAGVALGAAAASYGSGYYASVDYGNSGNGAYASADDVTSGGDIYILHGSIMSGADAVAYCAQNFRSYDIESRTFLAASGLRVFCPQ